MKLEDTYYSLLGIETDASLREIQNAYRNKIRVMHPDVNKSADAENKFHALHAAYEVLIDPDKRSEYDASIGVVDKKSVFRDFSNSSDEIRMAKKLGLEDELEDTSDNISKENEPELLSRLDSLLSHLKPGKKNSSDKNPAFKEKLTRIKNLGKDALFGQRKYQFTIDTLESVLGTERQLVFKDHENNTKKIMVKIPKGIVSQSVLQVPVSTAMESKPRIVILVSDHPYLKRDGNNLTLQIPFHERENRSDDSVVLFTAVSEVRVTIPKESFKALRIKSHGLIDTKYGTRGDFLILPVLSTEPAEEDQQALEKKFRQKRQEIYDLLKPLHAD
jgi:DnaJ-class molecular chaperone